MGDMTISITILTLETVSVQMFKPQGLWLNRLT